MVSQVGWVVGTGEACHSTLTEDRFFRKEMSPSCRFGWVVEVVNFFSWLGFRSVHDASVSKIVKFFN